MKRIRAILFAVIFAIAVSVVFKINSMPLNVPETLVVLLVGFAIYIGTHWLYVRATKLKKPNE